MALYIFTGISYIGRIGLPNSCPDTQNANYETRVHQTSQSGHQPTHFLLVDQDGDTGHRNYDITDAKEHEEIGPHDGVHFVCNPCKGESSGLVSGYIQEILNHSPVQLYQLIHNELQFLILKTSVEIFHPTQLHDLLRLNLVHSGEVEVDGGPHHVFGKVK